MKAGTKELLEKELELSRFTAGIAHDLNNVFSVILNYTGFIAMELPESSKLREDVDEITKAAQRGAAISRSLHVHTQNEILRPTRFSLNPFLKEFTPLIREMVGPNIAINCRLGDEPMTFEMDPIQFEGVLKKIIEISKASISGQGAIYFDTYVREFDQDTEGRHAFMKPGRYACLEISDTGQGWPEKDRVNIFSPYHPSELVVVYGIIKHYKGNITIYSEPKLGTVYKIYFPIEPQGLAVINPHRVADASDILLVENDDRVRSGIARLLSRQGHIVYEASTIEMVERFFSEGEVSVQLIITDTVLMDGMASRYFKNKNGMPKVIYMSGYSEFVLKYHHILSEGDVFLSKPFSEHELHAAIEKISAVDGSQRPK